MNNAVYFTYFEQCRLEWWRHLGGTTGMPGAAAIIVHAACNYRAPAFVSEELEIRLAVDPRIEGSAKTPNTPRIVATRVN